MNRRGFLKGLSAVVAGIALEEAIPLGRVWSFPKEIVRPALTFDKIPKHLRFHRDAFAMVSVSFEWDDYERIVKLQERLYEPPKELQEAFKRGVLGETLSLPSAS